MNKILFLNFSLIIGSFFYSVNEKKNENYEIQKDEIKFDFRAKKIDTLNRKSIEVTSSLYNEKEYSIYFLTTSCEGEQYLLKFDESKFKLTPFLFCNATFPRIIEIKPKQKYSFKSYFEYKNQKTIKLGFEYFPANEKLKLNEKKLQPNIFDQLEKNKLIIWSVEKEIE